MKLLALLFGSTSLSNNRFSADWNEKQKFRNLVSDVKFEI